MAAPPPRAATSTTPTTVEAGRPASPPVPAPADAEVGSPAACSSPVAASSVSSAERDPLGRSAPVVRPRRRPVPHRRRRPASPRSAPARPCSSPPRCPGAPFEEPPDDGAVATGSDVPVAGGRCGGGGRRRRRWCGGCGRCGGGGCGAAHPGVVGGGPRRWIRRVAGALDEAPPLDAARLHPTGRRTDGRVRPRAGVAAPVAPVPVAVGGAHAAPGLGVAVDRAQEPAPVPPRRRRAQPAGPLDQHVGARRPRRDRHAHLRRARVAGIDHDADPDLVGGRGALPRHRRRHERRTDDEPDHHHDDRPCGAERPGVGHDLLQAPGGGPGAGGGRRARTPQSDDGCVGHLPRGR